MQTQALADQPVVTPPSVAHDTPVGREFQVTLDRDSLRFAIAFLARHSDGDIFPPLPEISSLSTNPEPLVDLMAKPLSEFQPQASRRLLVPKDALSYRQATQLHPQDSILLTALLHQYGGRIEARRLSTDTVFSYRFDPTLEHGLYGGDRQWNSFWSTAATHNDSHVLYCDIADFYNQIPHHTLENELIISDFPNQAAKWVKSLLFSITGGVSRGIPIGPHASHLLAECTMIPIDSSLKANGLDFIRYADDIVIFCKSRLEAEQSLRTVARILDKQQHLLLQDHKTAIFDPDSFQKHCKAMVEDRPISEEEDAILSVIQKYSDGDPYVSITYDQIDPDDWESISEDIITTIIDDYLAKDPIDYVRLRWFFRRLAQVGHYGALQSVVSNTNLLEPCLPSVCSYIASIQEVPPESWRSLGAGLLDSLDRYKILDTEFGRMAILSLFYRNGHINHFSKIGPRFGNADSHTKREILLAAQCNSEMGWIRENKEDWRGMDPWQRLAFIHCVSILPKDERKLFLKAFGPSCPFEERLIQWATGPQP